MVYCITVSSLHDIESPRVNLPAIGSIEEADALELHDQYNSVDVEVIFGVHDFSEGIWLTTIDGIPVFDPIPYHAIIEGQDIVTIASELRAFELLWMQSINENQYRLTAHWYFLERQIIEASGGRCTRCGASERPVKAYRRRTGRKGYERPKDVVVLCKTCYRAGFA